MDTIYRTFSGHMGFHRTMSTIGIGTFDFGIITKSIIITPFLNMSKVTVRHIRQTCTGYLKRITNMKSTGFFTGYFTFPGGGHEPITKVSIITNQNQYVRHTGINITHGRVRINFIGSNLRFFGTDPILTIRGGNVNRF